MPFDECLVGRLVINPERPFDDYIDFKDLGVDEFRTVRTAPGGPITETIYELQYDMQSISSATEGITVTSTQTHSYWSPCLWPNEYPPALREGVKTATIQLGMRYYIVVAVRTIEDYRITAPRYAMDTPETKLNRIETALTPRTWTASDNVVLAMIFRGITIGELEGTLSATLAPGGIYSSFLNWGRGPSLLSAFSTDVEAPNIPQSRLSKGPGNYGFTLFPIFLMQHILGPGCVLTTPFTSLLGLRLTRMEKWGKLN